MRSRLQERHFLLAAKQKNQKQQQQARKRNTSTGTKMAGSSTARLGPEGLGLYASSKRFTMPAVYGVPLMK
jgi:hypothetical protein